MATNAVDLYRLSGTASASADAVASRRNDLLARILDLGAGWWRYRRTVAELEALNDRTLDDIGVARDAIPSVARRYAFAQG